MGFATLKNIRLTLIGAAALIMTACASATAPVPAVTFANDLTEAKAVLSAGFASISDKYIDQVSLETIATESVRGLAALDPALTVDRRRDALVLRRYEEEVAEADYPDSDNPGDWGAMAANLTQQASLRSSELRYADSEAVFQAMFDGALAELDVYSRYAGAAEADENRERRDGFGGIGVRFRVVDDRAVITDVINGSPASGAKIAVGDVITHVDGQSVEGLSPYALTEKLRGTIRSSLRLTVRRPEGEILSYDLQRTHIVPPTVEANLKDGILGVRVKSFNQGTAQSLASVLEKNLPSGEIKGVILDLRGNPGGLLRQSVEVADTFLAEGRILDTLGRHPDSIQHYEAAGRDFADGLPLVVLIDGRSASAAEIVAAALQDMHRAVVVGTASYGKGTVQTVVRLPNDGEITLTWSRFMAPSGYALHGLGVFPVLCVADIDNASRDALVAALDRQPATSETLNTWRHTAFDNIDTRRALRSQCPPSRRGRNTDLEIAHGLINDGVLYERALQITTLAEQGDTAQALAKPHH